MKEKFLHNLCSQEKSRIRKISAFHITLVLSSTKLSKTLKKQSFSNSYFPSEFESRRSQCETKDLFRPIQTRRFMNRKSFDLEELSWRLRMKNVFDLHKLLLSLVIHSKCFKKYLELAVLNLKELLGSLKLLIDILINFVSLSIEENFMFWGDGGQERAIDIKQKRLNSSLSVQQNFCEELNEKGDENSENNIWWRNSPFLKSNFTQKVFQKPTILLDATSFYFNFKTLHMSCMIFRLLI